MVKASIDESVLPRWNMEKLYGYIDLNDTKYLSDFEELNNRAKSFYELYYNNLESSLEDAVVEYSDINMKYRDLDQFVSSMQSINRDDNNVIKSYSSYNTKRGEIHGQYIEWFTLQMIRLPESVVEEWLNKSAKIKSIESWIRNVRLLAPHILSEEVEKALTLRENWYGTSPVVEYFSNILVKARYNFPRKYIHEGDASNSTEENTVPLNESRLLNYLLDPDYEIRRAALKVFNDGLSVNQVTHFSCLSLNQVAGKEAIENKVRNWPTIRSARNLSNQLPDAVVNALITAVREDGVRINKRFYLLKRKILQKKTGRTEFAWFDRNAPLTLKTGSKRRYEWSECIEVVDRSFDEFSKVFSSMFRELVDQGRIDALVTPGKRGGAFCMLGTPNVGPVVFTNYLGKDEDVSTVAHECGHAIHGMLTYQQPFLMQDPATAIAEVASIFGEMLVFKKLLLEETDVEAKLDKLMEKLNSIMNTVVRQMSFDRFEELVHTAKKDGFVSEEDMSKMWLQSTQEFYGSEGEVFTDMSNMENMWAYVPHFHELPFYVYSYAFADLTVGTLYALYEKNVFPSDRNAQVGSSTITKESSFQERFIHLLASGSSKSFVEMVSAFDLDGASPQYWRSAFTDYIEPLLVMAEELAEKL